MSVSCLGTTPGLLRALESDCVHQTLAKYFTQKSEFAEYLGQGLCYVHQLDNRIVQPFSRIHPGQQPSGEFSSWPTGLWLQWGLVSQGDKPILMSLRWRKSGPLSAALTEGYVRWKQLVSQKASWIQWSSSEWPSEHLHIWEWRTHIYMYLVA